MMTDSKEFIHNNLKDHIEYIIELMFGNKSIELSSLSEQLQDKILAHVLKLQENELRYDKNDIFYYKEFFLDYK